MKRNPSWIKDAPQLTLVLTNPIESDDNVHGDQYVLPFDERSDIYRLVSQYGDESGNRSFVRVAENVSTGDIWVCFRPTILEGLAGLATSRIHGFSTVCTSKRTKFCPGNLLDVCQTINARQCDSDGLSKAHRHLLMEATTNTKGEPLIECIRRCLSTLLGRGERNIVFAGFSLGAAQALCAAVMVGLPVHCIQIAGPRVASRHQVSALGERLLSCTYVGVLDDPVSEMPFGDKEMSLVGDQLWVSLAERPDIRRAGEGGNPIAGVKTMVMWLFVIDVFIGLVFDLRWCLSDMARTFINVHLKAERLLTEGKFSTVTKI
ncbi:hypothetical protein HDU89_001546 [Geranomyces variabilis]|nr:hypothetical protein HDU89_001546 [Geranomyces variabilis]